MKRIYNFIENTLKEMMRSIHLLRYHIGQFKKEQKEHPEIVYFIMTPNHGNLGDQAIAIATEKILKETGLLYREISMAYLRRLKKYHSLDVMDGYTIFIHGGGNIGTLWPDCEEMMESIIHCNPHSQIVLLPNTAFFADSESGRNSLEKAKHIFNSHRHLTIYARELFSYDFLRENFNNVKLCPDLVLSLNASSKTAKRCGCLLCLRRDCEKTLSFEAECSIETQVSKIFSHIDKTDMNINNRIDIQNRKFFVRQKMNEFCHAELVITDRLHGMILAAITGTPCIVLPSKSHKVLGCYRWIENLDYICFCDDVNRICEAFMKLPSGSHDYDMSPLSDYFIQLKQELQTIHNIR